MGDGLKLGPGLIAAADDGGYPGVLPRHVPGRYAACGAGAQLAEPPGVDDGVELTGALAVEVDDEAHAGGSGGVSLEADAVEGRDGGAHEVEHHRLADGAAAGDVVDKPLALKAKDLLDGVNSGRHVEEPVYVVLGYVECHVMGSLWLVTKY